MISGLDLNQTVEYVLKSDTENPTVWTLGVIPSYLFARISGSMKDNGIETVYRILQVALKGWSNFSVPFSTSKEKVFGTEMDVVPLSLLEQIPLQAISELSMKVMEINQLSGTERKN